MLEALVLVFEALAHNTAVADNTAVAHNTAHNTEDNTEAVVDNYKKLNAICNHLGNCQRQRRICYLSTATARFDEQIAPRSIHAKAPCRPQWRLYDVVDDEQLYLELLFFH